MPNDYYTPSGSPQSNSQGTSATIRSEFELLKTAFDKLPVLTTNPGNVLVVNTGGTAIETVLGPSGTVVGTSDTQTLTNKTLDLSSNTLTMTLAQLNTALSDANIPSGRMIAQRVSNVFVAVSSGVTVIPYDDTLPQNTEGDEYFTLSITPTVIGSTLAIYSWAHTSLSTDGIVIMALFKDSATSALAATWEPAIAPVRSGTASIFYEMTTTSLTAITFKIRIGGNTGTTTINGSGASRLLGGALSSGIEIKEILA